MSADNPRPFMSAAGELYLWETITLLVEQKGAADVEKVAKAVVKLAREKIARDAMRRTKAQLPSNVIRFPGGG